MKLAICNEMFEDWQIEDVFSCAAKLGYDAVELAPFTLAESVLDISQTERDRIRKGGGCSEDRNRWTSLAVGLAKGVARQSPRWSHPRENTGLFFRADCVLRGSGWKDYGYRFAQ